MLVVVGGVVHPEGQVAGGAAVVGGAFADAVAIGVDITGSLQPLGGGGEIELIVLGNELVGEPVAERWRHQTQAWFAESEEQRVDQLLLVDRLRQCSSYFHVAQCRVPRADPPVGAGSWQDRPC